MIKTLFLCCLYAANTYHPAAEFFYSEDQLLLMKKNALKGDSSDALKISNYYFMYKNDVEDGKFWLRISSENGNCEAVIRLAQYYISGEPSARNIERANETVAEWRPSCHIPTWLENKLKRTSP